MLKLRWLHLILLIPLYGNGVFAQNKGELPDDSSKEFSFADSLAIFKLIDSLMTMEIQEASQMAFRMGYNSNVLMAGRTLGITQFGLSPGVSYYHKTGLFADVTSYWSRDFDPSFYLTTASVGYMHLFSSKFSVIANYDHYFYMQEDRDELTYFRHALSASPTITTKYVTFRVDYSYFFGATAANRIMPALSFNLKRNKVLGLDHISFYPTVLVLFGDEKYSTIEFERPATLVEALLNIQQYGTRFSPKITEHKVFGVMNYAFSFPLNVSAGNWIFNTTYTYNIPKALDGEPLTLKESGFLSASIIYYLDFGRNKSSL